MTLITLCEGARNFSMTFLVNVKPQLTEEKLDTRVEYSGANL